MRKTTLIALILGFSMSTLAASDLPNFDELWNFNNPSETEIKFRTLLPQARVSGDKEYYLQLMTQIARTQGLQRKFEEAHKTLDDVQQALGSQTPRAEVRYLLERGRVLNSSKKPNEASPLFEKAFRLAKTLEMDNLAVDAAHMVAIAEPQAVLQMEWNFRALAIAENSKDPKARDWLGSLYNNVGWTLHGSGKFEEALTVFEKALAFRQTKGVRGPIRIAEWCVARTYRSMKRFDAALEIQLKLEKEFQAAGEKDGYVFEELGELYLSTSDVERSQKYFSLAFEELSKDESLRANEPERLERLRALSGVN